MNQAEVTQLESKVIVDKEQLVLLQLLSYSVLTKNLKAGDGVTKADIACLVLLALSGETDLSDFCNKAVDSGLYKSPESVRNALSSLETRKLVVKKPTTKNQKSVLINPAINIKTEGIIVLDYRYIYKNEN